MADDIENIRQDTDVTIRLVGTESISLLRELACEIFPHTYRTILSPDQIDYMMDMMYSEEALLSQMEERGDKFAVVWVDGNAVGYLSVRPDGPAIYHLEKLYTLPSVRGRGIGQMLLDYAKTMASSMSGGAPCRLELNVNRQNPAVGFYLHQGMHEAARGDFPIGGGYFMNDYIMAIDIPSKR